MTITVSETCKKYRLDNYFDFNCPPKSQKPNFSNYVWFMGYSYNPEDVTVVWVVSFLIYCQTKCQISDTSSKQPITQQKEDRKKQFSRQHQNKNDKVMPGKTCKFYYKQYIVTTVQCMKLKIHDITKITEYIVQ